MKKTIFKTINDESVLARLSGTIQVSQEESVYLLLRKLNIRKGNPIKLDDQPVIAAGTYFGNAEFDISSPSDVQPYDCSIIRKLKREEVYMIGDLTTNANQSSIQGFRIYVEAHDEEHHRVLMNANGKFTVLEGQLVIFSLETGDEECGLLITNVNPLP